MAYIDPCSATNDVDMREFMSRSLVLFLVGADDNYCGDNWLGAFQPRFAERSGLATEPHSGVTPAGPITMV